MIRKQMERAISPELREGETVVSVSMAQRHDAFVILGALAALLGLMNYFIVAYTDQRIIIAYTGKMGIKKVKRVVAELPLDYIPAPTGVLTSVEFEGTDGPEKIRIVKRFYKDLQGGQAKLPAA